MDINFLPIAAALVFILLDVVSGILKAAMLHELSSSKARSGIYHKSAYILIIASAMAIEWAMGFLDLGFSVPIMGSACALISLTEVMSIIENVAVLNPDLAGTKLLGLFKNSADIRENVE